MSVREPVIKHYRWVIKYKTVTNRLPGTEVEYGPELRDIAMNMCVLGDDAVTLPEEEGGWVVIHEQDTGLPEQWQYIQRERIVSVVRDRLEPPLVGIIYEPPAESDSKE